MILVSLFCVSLCGGMVWGYQNVPQVYKLVEDHGRFDHWKQIVTDLNGPVMNDSEKTFPLTGVGVGSFKYVYHVQHRNSFHQAHNDYLEIAYNTGIIGIALFLLAMLEILRRNICFSMIRFGRTDRYKAALLSSFVCIAVCAMGTFPWQVGTTVFYTMVIVGLLHNKKTIGELYA